MTTMAMTERPQTPDAVAIEQVLIGGDLSKLTPAQRLSYYKQVCESLQLNPLTKPFEYITLNNKLTLYAKKDCSDQLRRNHAVSVQIAAREVTEDCYVVTAQASLPSGRRDESIGAVSIAGLKGENRANAMMKAETKAKRRVTLSICGLGMLDETEVATIQADAGPSVVSEVIPSDDPPVKPDGYDAWLAILEGVADDGQEELRKAWQRSTRECRAYLLATASQTWQDLKARALEHTAAPMNDNA